LVGPQFRIGWCRKERGGINATGQPKFIAEFANLGVVSGQAICALVDPQANSAPPQQGFESSLRRLGTCILQGLTKKKIKPAALFVEDPLPVWSVIAGQGAPQLLRPHHKPVAQSRVPFAMTAHFPEESYQRASGILNRPER
jgi:hypothetical protein